LKRILLTEPMHAVAAELAAARPDVEIVQAADTDPATLRRLIAGAHAVGVRTCELREEVLSAAPDLQVVSRHGVGCDNVDVAHLTGRGIPVAIAAGANAASVAEHTLMLMLACARGLLRQDRAVRGNLFTRRDGLVGGDLEGARALIVGFGRVGRQVARRCRAFGMAVTVADIALDRALAAELGCRAVADFRPELPDADFLSLHVPLDATTRHLVSDPELDAIRPGAVVINCARGGVVDEAALVRALDAGRVSMAGVDVFDPEPPAADHPFMGRDDMVLTPHTGAASRGSMREMARMTMQNMLDCFDGRLRPDCTFNRAGLDGS
jgi:D-3-phosphoglycerate dehydrogenase